MTRVLTIAVALSVAAGGTAAHASSRLPCPQRPGVTDYADPALRVLHTLTGRRGDQVLRIFACRTAWHRATLLLRTRTNLDAEVSLRAVARSGGYFAIEVLTAGGTFDDVSLTEHTLSMSRVAHLVFDPEASIPGPTPEPGDNGWWLARSGGLVARYGDAADAQLVGYDGAGRRVIAAAPDDVAVGGSTVYWTADGTAHSAVLTGHPRGAVAQ